MWKPAGEGLKMQYNVYTKVKELTINQKKGGGPFWNIGQDGLDFATVTSIPKS